MGYCPYESRQNQGYRCVGSTPGIAQEDWNALNNLSNYEVVAESGHRDNPWLPVWTMYWLPSGALAVGKTTFFEERDANDRNNRVSHYYIIDHAQAMANSDRMERLFTLPFIDYNLNTPATERQRTVLQDMVDVETLEQAGAKPVLIMPLGTLLDDHVRIYLDLLRNMVEGTLDSAFNRERQMLCAYDSSAPNSEEIYTSLMGWIYRLIPKHLRDQVGFSMPYNLMSSSSLVQLTMVPEVNVKVSPYSQTCRNGLGGKCADILLGCSYLYTDARISGVRDPYGEAQSVIYHAISGKPELYNSGLHYFSTFLENRIRALYYNSAENEHLQAFYNQLYLDGWNSGPLFWNRTSLELMGWYSNLCENTIHMDARSLRQQLYTWLEHLKNLADNKALPQTTCADLQESILLKLCSMDEAESDESWIKALKSMIAAPTRDTVMKNTADGSATLAGACISLAAIAVAKIWIQNHSEAIAKCSEWFSGMQYQQRSVYDAVLDLLTTAGEPNRQARWEKAGVSCDIDATLQRINDLLCSAIEGAANLDALFDDLQRSAQPLELFQTHLLDNTTTLLLSVSEGWMREHLMQPDDSLLHQICQYQEQFQQDTEHSNNALICGAIAEQMWLHCQNILKAQYQNPSMDNLLTLKSLCQPHIDDALDPLWKKLHPFYQELFEQMLPQVLTDLEQADMSEDLIISAATMMDLCSIVPDENRLYNRSVRLYDRVCNTLLDINHFSDKIIQIPSFVTAQWLSYLNANGYLRPDPARCGANVLTLLMCRLNDIPISLELSTIVGREEGVLLQKRLVYLYKDGRHLMPPAQLYSLIKNGVCELSADDAILLLRHYRPSDFYAYVDWLRTSDKWPDLIEVLKLLPHNRLFNRLDWELLKKILSQLCSDYENDLIPPEYEEDAQYCTQALWDSYKVPIMERIMEKKYVIQYEKDDTDLESLGASYGSCQETPPSSSPQRKFNFSIGIFGGNKQKKAEYENVNIIDEPFSPANNAPAPTAPPSFSNSQTAGKHPRGRRRK